MKRNAQWLASLCLVGACLTPKVDVTPLNASPHRLEARPPESVAIFMSQPPGGVLDLFLIEATGGVPDRRIPAIRSEAARLGCDAVVIRSQVADRQTHYTTNEDPLGGTASTPGHVGAICIIFTNRGAPGASD